MLPKVQKKKKNVSEMNGIILYFRKSLKSGSPENGRILTPASALGRLPHVLWVVSEENPASCRCAVGHRGPHRPPVQISGTPAVLRTYPDDHLLKLTRSWPGSGPALPWEACTGFEETPCYPVHRANSHPHVLGLLRENQRLSKQCL